MKYKIKACLTLTMIIPVMLTAQVKLPALIRDSMILQRDTKLTVWGWASPKEKITVKMNGKTYRAAADAAGNWQVQLPPAKAGGPHSMEIKGKNRIVLKDILFGDVWLCSGQSNMVHQMNIHDVTYAKEIAEANYPEIRQCWIPALTNLQEPADNLPPVYWKAAVGDEVRPFSAVAYFFAKKIYDTYKTPIGIINASVGGTPVEAWISGEGLRDFESLQKTIEQNKDTAAIHEANRRAAAAKPALPADAGLTEAVKWYEPAYAAAGWRNIHIPGYWEDQGLKNLDGVVWYRKEINIPASMAARPARVFLGRIIDADELYINGQKTGATYYQYPQRRYSVPAGLLREGKNTFVIRVTNTSGKGGFVPDKPYCIFSGTDTIDLKGDWQYKVGAAYRPGASQPAYTVNIQNQPAALFNAMIAPVINYAIKGICWYQGESNASQPQQYASLMKALIEDWRRQWKKKDLPFLYVQLPGYMDYSYLPAESNWALIREAQLQTLTVPSTGMAIAIDLGEWNDIHPDNKKDVGERLALPALQLAYGENIVSSGPLYQSYAVENNKIIITFSHTGTGLTTSDGKAPAAFAIAGADKKFVWARTKIEGNNVIVWSEEVKEPTFVRYAWADNPVNPNLYNKEGLPASPFRTDQ